MENDKTLLPEEEKNDPLGKETGGATSLQPDDQSGDKKGDNNYSDPENGSSGGSTLGSR